MPALSAYALLLLGLVLKYGVLTGIRGRHRLRARVFRWPEDARYWRGKLAPQGEEDVVERAQAVLRNDGESQPLLLSASLLWVLLGAAPMSAYSVFALYLGSRFLHALFFLSPRQPHRNRVFVVGQLCLLYVVVDAFRLAFFG